MNKNVTAASFKTFISVLREEQKERYMLVKFDYKNGYFCGVLSNDKMIPGMYHNTLASINPDSKELVLKQIMNLVEAAHGNPPMSFVAEGEGYDTKLLNEESVPAKKPRQRRVKK